MDNIVNVLKVTAWFTLKWLMFCCVTFTPTKRNPIVPHPRRGSAVCTWKPPPHILQSPDLQSQALATPNRSPPAPSGLRVVAPHPPPCSTLEVNSLTHPLTAQAQWHWAPIPCSTTKGVHGGTGRAAGGLHRGGDMSTATLQASEKLPGSSLRCGGAGAIGAAGL